MAQNTVAMDTSVRTNIQDQCFVRSIKVSPNLLCRAIPAKKQPGAFFTGQAILQRTNAVIPS